MSRPVSIRHMLDSDLPQVVAIEEDVYDDPWFKQDFINAIAQRNTLAIVALRSRGVLGGRPRVCGYCVYRHFSSGVLIQNIAVARHHWRTSVGRKMVEWIKEVNFHGDAFRLVAEIRETNLLGQVFFRGVGLRAEKIIRGKYEDSDEDAYRFVYRAASAARVRGAGKHQAK